MCEVVALAVVVVGDEDEEEEDNDEEGEGEGEGGGGGGERDEEEGPPTEAASARAWTSQAQIRSAWRCCRPVHDDGAGVTLATGRPEDDVLCAAAVLAPIWNAGAVQFGSK